MRPRAFLIGLLTAAAGYWLWFGLTQRSITGDDGISILAARSILEHGYPKLPSGFVYHRAHLANYLLAASMGLLGVNDLGILLPGLLMALGVLWLVYRFAAEALGRPWAGVAAAALLVWLQPQTFYATGARMYMALQFFTVLAWYGAWRGYLRGSTPFQWFAVLAGLGAILCHQQAAVMVAAMPLAIGAVRRMQGAKRPAISWPLAAAGMAAGACAVWWSVFYKPAWRMPLIAGDGGINPRHAVLSLNPSQWVGHLFELESTVPFGVLLLPVVAWWLWEALRTRTRPASQAAVWTAALFGLLASGAAINIRQAHWRFWVPYLPMYAVLLAAAAARLWSAPPRRQRAWATGLAVWAAVVVLVSGRVFGPGIYLTHLRQAYGLPCQTGSTCDPMIEDAYARLRPAIKPEDLIITSNPMVTHYYLGRVDGFLRQRGRQGELGAFAHPADELFGAPLIDTPEEVEALVRAPRRAWVIIDYKSRKSISPSLRKLVGRLFRSARRDGQLTVHTN